MLVMASLTATVGPLGATGQLVVPPSQEQPRSTWVQPGTGPLDVLGAFFLPFAPAPGPTQASPLGYEYTLGFDFEDGSGGVLVLGHQNGQKVAGFGLFPSHLVDIVPFDWEFGHVYFLMVHRLSPVDWGAWVYDWSATTWDFVGQQRVPAGTGGIVPTSTTGVDFDASLAPAPSADPSSCSFYQRVDTYVHPPLGWRGSVLSLATLGASTAAPGDCPGTTTDFHGWQHYALGTTAAS